MRTMWMAAPGPSGAAHQQPTAVLVVENTETGSMLAAALQKKGWRVTLCHAGAHALDSVRTQPWDALVIGFRLLDMRGDAVLHAARAERPEMAARTLLLTTDAVGVAAAAAADCASLPTETPTDEIVSRITKLIQDATAL
jgi:DNA-binding response OmpR family regulator